MRDQILTNEFQNALHAEGGRSSSAPPTKHRESARPGQGHGELGAANAVMSLLAGPYGADARALLGFLKNMTLTSAAELVDTIDRPWREADADTRFEVLSLIDDAIVALRERNGLPPLDDPLPGQPDNVFSAPSRCCCSRRRPERIPVSNPTKQRNSDR
jgi:hypothetical protein